MRRMSFLALLTLGLFAGPAAAQPYKKLVNQAAEHLEDAEAAARRARGTCRPAVAEALDRATDRTYRLRKLQRPEEVMAVKAELNGVASTASVSGCPYPVLEGIQRAQEALEDVRVAMWRDGRGPGRAGDDDDDRARFPGQPLPGQGYLGALQVKPLGRYEHEQAVKVSVPELRLMGMQGRSFYFGARFRSYEGPWTEWVTTQQWSVTQDPYTWRNPFNHFFRASSLSEQDHAQGRFVAQVAVFDGETGQMLATREASFRADVPRLPDAPPLPPPAPPMARDCGTGSDPGCTMSRDGLWPLEAQGFGSLQEALRQTPSELARSQLVQSAFSRNAVTAVQYGMLLDFFPNEGLKLSVARAGAPRVVNPQYALGYAGKWTNPDFQGQYVDLIRAQRPGQPTQPEPMPMPGPQQPQPMPPQPLPPGPPGPGGLPQGQYRDCGTGQDPGCQLSRNGKYPLDAVSFRGVLAALQSTPNELSKKDYCLTVFQREVLTAEQLGEVLKFFPNELVRLDVARAAAPRLVNARQALGLAATWRNPLLGQQFVQLIAAQP